MPKILQPAAPAVEDQDELLWSDPEAIQGACIAAMDELFGHDVDRLAAVLGISRRELNKQRERRPDLLRKQLLHRLMEIFHATATRFGPARTAKATRLLAHAGGHQLANTVPAAAAQGDRGSALAVISRTVREVCDAATKFSARAEDGLDRQDAHALLPEFDEAMEELQAARNLLVQLARPEVVGEAPRRTRA